MCGAFQVMILIVVLDDQVGRVGISVTWNFICNRLFFFLACFLLQIKFIKHFLKSCNMLIFWIFQWRLDTVSDVDC